EVDKLQAALGVPVIPVDPRTGGGVRDLLAALNGCFDQAHDGNALRALPSDPAAAFTALRELLKKSGTVHQTPRARHETDPLTARIDRYALHRIWGFPIFLLSLISLFGAIFWAARPFMDLVDAAFKGAGDIMIRLLGDSMLTRFVAQGLVGGVGS